MSSVSERARAGVRDMPQREQHRHQPLDRLVSDDEVGNAVRFLAENAAAIGHARQRMVETEALVKSTEALLITGQSDGAMQLRQAVARADPKWMEANVAHAEAVGEFQKMQALREGAAAKIEMWRSEQASLRQAGTIR